MRRRVVYAVPILVVAAQALYVRAGHPEPYPALMMPAFAGSRTAPDGAIGVTVIEVTVRFEDGTATALPIKTLLAPIPRMTTMEASEHVFRGDPPRAGLIRWLRHRLDVLYPGRRVKRVDVGWYRDGYRIEGGEMRRIAHLPTDTYLVDLSR